jgi:hypothetical protein
MLHTLYPALKTNFSVSPSTVCDVEQIVTDGQFSSFPLDVSSAVTLFRLLFSTTSENEQTNFKGEVPAVVQFYIG